MCCVWVLQKEDPVDLAQDIDEQLKPCVCSQLRGNVALIKNSVSRQNIELTAKNVGKPDLSAVTTRICS